MNKKKWTSLLMILALLLTLLPAPELSATAEGEQPSGSGMEIKKTATANDDGTYTITLEAYATGSKVISQVTKDIPTDIILVLDQSGSMDYAFETVKEDTFVSYGFQKNSENYTLRHNNNSNNAKKNLYYKLDDGGYAQVSVTKTPSKIKDYVEYANVLNYSCNHSEDTLYAKTDEGYKTVSVSYSWNTYTYTYTLNDGTVVTRTSDDLYGHPPYTIYRFQEVTVYTYEYSYTKDGITTIIGTQSEGDDTVFDIEFYQYVSSGSSVKRLSALKSAVTSFANAVAKKAAGADGQLGTTDDVNHRIAVVGFASESDFGDNTELLSISGGNSGSVGVAYGSINDQNLKDVLQSMNTVSGQKMVGNAINALAAQGATRTDLGVDMAKRILEQNPVETDEKRNRVVIVFTDGVPTSSSNYDSAVANSAISYANSIKNAKATVYTIGIFSGADATSAGNQNGNETQKANWFMQNLSSNNGEVPSQGGSGYYLSAGNSGSLNSIFQQISGQIQTGGSSTTLDENTVIKDIISPSFVLQTGTAAEDIVLETYACTGIDANGKPTFAKTKNTANLGENVELTSSENNVSVDNPKVPDQVNVTGFDFSANWCGVENNNGVETPHGNKLVIKIKVKPRPGFLGGNDVYTNTSAGVYENASATEPVLPFDRPQTDVTIKNPEITLPDANVYLGAYFSETVNAEDLKKGTKIKFGEKIELDLSKPDWGLESWQTDYVKIVVEVTDENGNVVEGFGNLREDTNYKVSVSITPKTPKDDNNGFEKSMMGTIHVFKPQLTFKDSTVEYKKTTVNNPTYYNDNNKGDNFKVWKNGDKTSDDQDVSMMGTEPDLTLGYEPKSGSLAENGLVISTEDIPVKVTVMIGGEDVTQYTTFVHQACEDTACQWENVKNADDLSNPAFLLHVKDVYADLTITKSGADTDADPGQSFLFTVTGPDYSTEVIIVGNGSVTLKNLRIGEYTVTENTNWSWRYTPTTNNNPQTITLEANKTNTVTINNMREKDQWLDGNVRADNKFTGAAATTN